MDTSTALLAIKPLHYQGQQLLKEQWPQVVQKLRSALQALAFEESESSNSLLLFTFNHPYSAITATLSYANSFRRDFAPQFNECSLPFQIIIHLPSGNEINSPYRNPNAKLWEMIESESIHITKAVKTAWEWLMAKKNLPPAVLSNEGNGLFKVMMTIDESIAPETILACRDLPIKGKGQPCFYCSMTSHAPANCPNKLLTMEHYGLASVGYLSFDQISTAFQKAFSNVAAITKHLAGGIPPKELRKNPTLLVFVAFFDIYRIYQPRFLSAIAFSRHRNWKSICKPVLRPPDNKNLHLGIDSLRVGKHGQAEELLMRECNSKSAHRFAATIGMAFVYLEQKGLASMRSYLEMAKSFALLPNEHIYSDLLLSRFYDLIGEVWKARDIIKNVTTAQVDCPDGFYRKLQLEAKDNFSVAACQLLRSLVVDQRNLFMAALIDPALIPIQTKVEDLLLSQYGTITSNAQDSISKVKNELEEITIWCDSNDPQIQASKASFDTLNDFLEKKSYFGALDVEHKAKVLLSSLRQAKEEKLNDLYDQIAKAKAQVREYSRFWNEYRYKIFFKPFIQYISSLEKPLNEAGELAMKSEGTSYRRALELIKITEKTLAEAALTQNRMNWTTLACDSAVSFMKKLAITEIVGIVLATAVVFGLGQLPKGNTLEGLAVLANDPTLQRKATVLTAVLIAPLLALSWTIKNQLQDG